MYIITMSVTENMKFAVTKMSASIKHLELGLRSRIKKKESRRATITYNTRNDHKNA